MGWLPGDETGFAKRDLPPHLVLKGKCPPTSSWAAALERTSPPVETGGHRPRPGRSPPGDPWYAKAWVGLVVAYAFSPIDLIPEFIPVLGQLDDLLLVPLGIALACARSPAK